jgi:predicted deacetylase
LASAEAMTAMADVGLAYTTTQRHIVDLRDNQRHPIFALSHRPGSSLSGAAASWVEMAASHRLHNSHPVRLALHPRDVDHPRLRAATDRVLDMAQRRGVVSSTYAGYLGVEYAVR